MGTQPYPSFTMVYGCFCTTREELSTCNRVGHLLKELGNPCSHLTLSQAEAFQTSFHEQSVPMGGKERGKGGKALWALSSWCFQSFWPRDRRSLGSSVPFAGLSITGGFLAPWRKATEYSTSLCRGAGGRWKEQDRTWFPGPDLAPGAHGEVSKSLITRSCFGQSSCHESS